MNKKYESSPFLLRNTIINYNSNTCFIVLRLMEKTAITYKREVLDDLIKNMPTPVDMFHTRSPISRLKYYV